MFLFVRFCIVVCLVLLQLVAPLIHAHKNDKNISGISFHLPEFKQVNLLLEKTPMMISSFTQEGQIVTVSAGIKENQKRFLSNNINAVLLFFIFITFLLRTAKCFSIHSEPINFFYFFNLSAPRAPPLRLIF